MLIALGLPTGVVPLPARLSQQDHHRRRQGGHVRQPQLVERRRKTNRDASLIFDDEEIADYLAEVYEYDWTTLATAHPTKASPRVAKAGEETPKGFKRVPFTAVFEDGA